MTRDSDLSRDPDVTVTQLAAGVLTPGGTADATRAEARVHALLDDIGPLLASHAGTGGIEHKSDGTPVTAHDRWADERFSAMLQDAFPTHGMISEEAVHVAPATDWTWVLDPIDGTSNFIAGVPYWCVSIALCLEGAPVLAVVDAPMLRRRFVAITGLGARDARGPLAVSRPVDATDPRNNHIPGLYSGGAARRLQRGGARLNARLLGATALDLAFVAAGVAPLGASTAPHVWDVAAGGLLVIEAGGVCATLGQPTLLPLTPGTDYRAMTSPTLAAPDIASIRSAAALLNA
jgi:myo-inositol-1(or 4)-monophosphatase